MIKKKQGAFDSIPIYAFFGITTLKSVSLPDITQIIHPSAFAGCTELEDVNWGRDLLRIGDSAFLNCALTKLALPEKVTTIELNAFGGCDKLNSVTLPKSLKNLAGNPFSQCPAISEFHGESSLISHDRFSGDAVFLIDERNQLHSYAIGNNMSDLYIPDGVVGIDDGAFSHSTLSYVTIPSSVTSIGEAAFANCPNLYSIDNLATTPPAIYNETFRNLPDDCRIYIPGIAAMVYNDQQSQPNWYDLRNHFSYTQRNNEIWLHLNDLWPGNDATSLPDLEGDFGASLIPGGKTLLQVPGNKASAFASRQDELNDNTPVSFAIYPFDGEITKIPANAFSGEPWNSCLDWFSVAYVTEIGDGAFKGDSELVYFPISTDQALTSIGKEAFMDCQLMNYNDYTGMTIGLYSSVETIGDRAFQNCFSMVQFSAKKVKSLGESAFEGCFSLETVELGPLTSIKKRTFYGCSNLTSVSLDDLSALTSIGDNAFFYNGKLERIGNSDIVRLLNVETIGKQAFDFTSAFNAELELDKVKNISEYAFRSSKIKAVSAPMLETVGDYAFSSSKIRTFIAPTLKTVGEQAFSSVKTLYNLDLPSVVTLGNSCFASMDNLEQLTLGSNLTSIGSNIFNGSNNNGQLSLYFIGSTPPDPDAFDQGAFLYDSSTPFKFEGIYVPAGSKEAYRTVFESKLTNGAVTSSYLKEY